MSDEPMYDPMILYIVVRQSLGMGVGKIASQTGHVVRQLVLWYSAALTSMFPEEREERIRRIKMIGHWLGDGASRIIVLGADEKEWAKVRALPDVYVATDLGLTEVEAGTETVLGICPIPKSAAPAFLRRMRLLK